jgi:hypothetical protein
MTRRKFLFIFGAFAAVVCVVIVAIAMYSIEQEKKEIREKYGSDVAKLCDEPGGGNAAITNLTSTGQPLKFLVLTADGTYHEWHDKLPGDWRAEDSDSLSAVVCLESHSTMVETCPYTDPKDETKTVFTMNRVRPTMDMILLNPQTGARIAELTIQGGEPDACPDEAKGTKGKTVEKKGRDVSYNDFYTALTDFVTSVNE